MSKKKVAILTCITLFAAIAVAGCNQNDQLAQPVTADEVAGSYEFTQFEFVPDDEFIVSVNMLDSLVSLTELKLGTDDRFVLSYHFDGGAQRSIGGAMKINTGDIQLEAESGNEEALATLFLGDLITLDRKDMQLSASIPSTIDSTKFSADSTGGTLEIRLRPRTTN